MMVTEVQSTPGFTSDISDGLILLSLTSIKLYLRIKSGISIERSCQVDSLLFVFMLLTSGVSFLSAEGLRLLSALIQLMDQIMSLLKFGLYVPAQ